MQVYSMGLRGTGQCYASVFHGFERYWSVLCKCIPWVSEVLVSVMQVYSMGLRGTGQCYASVFHGFERYWSVLCKCIPWV